MSLVRHLIQGPVGEGCCGNMLGAGRMGMVEDQLTLLRSKTKQKSKPVKQFLYDSGVERGMSPKQWSAGTCASPCLHSTPAKHHWLTSVCCSPPGLFQGFSK